MANNSTHKTVNIKKLILPLAILAIVILSLLYVIKLKKDLKSEIQLLEEQKKEDIDYNKNAIFKDVEEDIPSDDIQHFEEFKDVSEDTIN